MARLLTEATIRATVIAHAIRLGKCPQPGASENRRVYFEVTAEDIAAGRQLINEQEAVYCEPKLTQVKLRRA